MIKALFNKENRVNNMILLAILFVAALLRYKGLTIQSLWLDELHTMNEADPSLPWADLFRVLKTSDQHPPLFFVLERLGFIVHGYNEWTARIIPATAGVLSVWATYRLGKEIANERLGLIAAAITCVNYYNLLYSQDARDYSFLWLFTTLSYAYFIRLYKTLEWKDATWYITTTVLLLYSHYFSLFVLVCQLVLFFVFWALESENRKKFLTVFVVSALIILVAYLPWVPFLMKMGEIKSFWIQMVWQDFYFNYFYEYFGNAAFVYIFLYIFLISYIVNIGLENAKTKEIKRNPLVLSFVFVFFTIVFSYMIPYLRSFFVVPMLVERYTIIVIPSLIIAIAFGVYLIKTPLVRYLLLAIFLILSLFDIIYIKDYYVKPHKEEFRTVTQSIVNRAQHHPVINQMTGWHQGYYLRTLGFKDTLFNGEKNAIVDSIIMNSSPAYTVDSFWLVSMHGDPDLADSTKAKLEPVFAIAGQSDFFGGWIRLYGRKK